MRDVSRKRGIGFGLLLPTIAGFATATFSGCLTLSKSGAPNLVISHMNMPRLEIHGSWYVAPGFCQSYTVHYVDEYGHPKMADQAISVSLSSSNGMISNDFCSTSTQSVTILPGTSSASFYFSLSAPTTATLYASPMNSSLGIWSATIWVTAYFSVMHEGWEHVRAFGSRTWVDNVASSPQVELLWKNMNSNTGSVVGYNLYRATSSGGYDWGNPVGTNIAQAAVVSTYGNFSTSFTDTSGITMGQTYYYTVRPVILFNAVLYEASTYEPFSEIRVEIPPPEMALVHRWMANREMCQLMNRFADPHSDYSCPYTGPGHQNSRMDMGYSFFVDVNEMGCRYSLHANCPGGTCIGNTASKPVASAVPDGTVYYDREDGTCYRNRNATTWQTAGEITASAELQAMASNSAGLPPLVRISQNRSALFCLNDADGATKRLPTRREQLMAAAWNYNPFDGAIDNIENGGAGNCNTDTGHGLYGGGFNSSDPETFPGLDTPANVRSVRTGSLATRNCTSRYGMQDLVGNVWEWSADQLSSCDSSSQTCVGSAGMAGSAALSNYHFDGSSGPMGALSSWLLSDANTYDTPNFWLPFGLPIVNQSAAATMFDTVSTGSVDFNDDGIWIDTSLWDGIARAAMIGGSWINGNQSGRYALSYSLTPDTYGASIGFRCAKPAP